MKTIITITLILISGFLLSGCVLNSKWQGFYYPDGCLVCEKDYIYSPIFNDKESCLSWAEKLKVKRNNQNDDFECGKNCKPPKNQGGMYVCDETIN